MSADQEKAEPVPVNRWPVNQVARKWLVQAKAPFGPDMPYLAQLAWWGFEANMDLPGSEEQDVPALATSVGRLLDPKLDPVRVTRWFSQNPNGPSLAEQTETLISELQAAKTWQQAAQVAMECFRDRIEADRD